MPLGIVASLFWEDFHAITKKYKADTEFVNKSALNHSDRIAATFGNPTINRTYLLSSLFVEFSEQELYGREHL